ncbi:MAG: hypothetical protein C0596_00030 [Marinilabiliales bacterium]|nr:MAG: hypothetical protein C0596_00030 [Marinilabiliales bacterium]
MKKTLLIIIIAAYSLSVFSQVKIPVATKSQINKFLNNKTYVVLKNDRLSDYNDAIEEAFNKHWTLTEYEFIYESDFKSMKNDADKSFVMINLIYFEKDKTQTLFDFIVATNGGNFRTVDDMPTICAVPLCYHGALESDYAYKIPLMIKFIQNHITTCRENPLLNEDNIADYYMDKSGSLKKKTLYLLKEEVEPEVRTKNSFATAYPYNFDYTTRENIKDIIDNNTKNAVILHLITPKMNNTLTYCIKIIIDTENGTIYYWDKHKLGKKSGDYLLKSDLKKLAKKE